MMELSIVIPVFNSEAYLDKNLENLVNQTADPECYEIIIVDDGSTDRSLDIYQQYAIEYQNIRFIRKENGGVSSARNAGIMVAKGKWITFVDSDDYVCDHYVETMISTCPEAALVLFDNYIERDGNVFKEKKWLIKYFESWGTKDQFNIWCCDNVINAPWDKRYLRTVIKENNIRFKEGLNLGEDLLFNLEYINCASNAYVSGQAVYVHTDNPQGLCRKDVSLKRMETYEEIYSNVIALASHWELGEDCLKSLNSAFLRIITNYAGMLYNSGVSSEDIKEIFKANKVTSSLLRDKRGGLKESIRCLLLKYHLYAFCGILSRGE